MTDKDVSSMIKTCIEEISRLRSRISELEPKAHAYDSLGVVLRLLPQPPQGHGEDIVWRLRKQLEELQPKAEVVGTDA